MATDLTTREKRKSATRGKRVWSRIGKGRAIGYRRSTEKGNGSWWVRVHVGGEEGSPYRHQVFAQADDVTEANPDENVLTYAQAFNLAAEWDPWSDDASTEADRKAERIETVADALDHYLRHAKGKLRSYDQLRHQFNRHVRDQIGEIPLSKLTRTRLEHWHRTVAESPIHRGKDQDGEPKLDYPGTEDEKRARKVTANRALKDLKAALNLCVKDDLIEPGPWGRVKAFKGVERARVRYLDHDEITALLGAAEGTFRDLLEAALLTGCRYGELTRLRVRDYRRKESALWIEKAKADRSRHVFLSDEGLALFDRLTKGRKGTEYVFLKDKEPWGKSHQVRPMRKVVATAEIDPPISFHGLRHTYASHYLMNGGSLVALAKQLGHSTTRMVEKHYGHLADEWRKEEARKRAPSIRGRGEK